MKKSIIMLMVGMLLVGVNVFAAGDLIVNGSLGVGVGTPSSKVDVSETYNTGTVTTRLMNVYGSAETGYGGVGFMGLNAVAKANPGVASSLVGFNMQAQHESDQNILSLRGGEFLVQYRGDSTTTVTESYALKFAHSKSSNSIGQTTVTNGYGFKSTVRNEDSAGKLIFDDFRHVYLEDVNNTGNDITTTSLAGIWVDQQSNGTSNYGIVLNGDGAGADIVFGASQEASIYSSGGELFAKDGLGNSTQISPHDPETGEWRFYSKNIKTGRVVEIKMEKLVKAIEQLTGETFMFESFEEMK